MLANIEFSGKTGCEGLVESLLVTSAISSKMSWGGSLILYFLNLFIVTINDFDCNFKKTLS